MKKKNRKLRPIIQSPENSPFDLDTRPPGWLPDTVILPDTSPPSEQTLFLEEILEYTGRFAPFAHPRHPGTADQTDQITAFLEPGEHGTCEDWNKFNKWILGYPIQDDQAGKNKLFNNWLRLLCIKVRDYNRALYRLRRAHITGNTGPLPEMPQLPNEPSGPDSVEDLEEDWKKAVEKLNALISKQFNNDTGIVWPLCDMVEVNNYIVSIRVVAVDEEPPVESFAGTSGTRARQVGGSSSSHISVSSAFSSQKP